MKRTTFIIGILLGLALIAGACRGCQLDETAAAKRAAALDTGVKGDRADLREAYIAFGRENLSLLQALAAHVESLDPSPHRVAMRVGLFFDEHMVAEYASGTNDWFDDAVLLSAFRDTPLSGIARYDWYDSGWIFELDGSSGMLDVGDYYDLLYLTSDPLEGDGWQPLGNGWTRSESGPGYETHDYIEPIADGMYYSYESWY